MTDKGENMTYIINESFEVTYETYVICEEFGEGTIDWSKTINTMANNYMLLLAEATPRLSKTELEALKHCLIGVPVSDDLLIEADRLDGYLCDALETLQGEEVLTEYDVSVKDLLHNVRDMTTAERICFFCMLKAERNLGLIPR